MGPKKENLGPQTDKPEIIPCCPAAVGSDVVDGHLRRQASSKNPTRTGTEKAAKMLCNRLGNSKIQQPHNNYNLLEIKQHSVSESERKGGPSQQQRELALISWLGTWDCPLNIIGRAFLRAHCCLSGRGTSNANPPFWVPYLETNLSVCVEGGLEEQQTTAHRLGGSSFSRQDVKV